MRTSIHRLVTKPIHVPAPADAGAKLAERNASDRDALRREGFRFEYQGVDDDARACFWDVCRNGKEVGFGSGRTEQAALRHALDSVLNR